MPTDEALAVHGYALALEEARRALNEQERMVTELRARAGTLISAATIATSFLGAPFIAARHLGPASSAAAGAFVLLTFATLVLLWPRWQFEFSLRAEDIIGRFVEPILHEPTPPPRLERELALHMDTSCKMNRARLNTMTMVFRRACLLLTIEIVAWVVAIVFNV
jgi:hypothetical protein